MRLCGIELDDGFFANKELAGKVISFEELENHNSLNGNDRLANYYKLISKYSEMRFNSRSYPIALAYYDNLTTIFIRYIGCLRNYDSYAVCDSIFDCLSRNYAHYQIGYHFSVDEESELTIIRGVLE